MIRVYLIACVLFFAMTSGARADFIFTPIFTALLAGTSLGGGAVIFGAVTYASFFSSIATALVTTAISFLFRPKVPDPEDGKIPQKGTVNPALFGGGRTRVAGTLVLDEVIKNNLFVVQALVGHKVSGFVRPYIGDKPIRLGYGSFNSTTGWYEADEDWEPEEPPEFWPYPWPPPVEGTPEEVVYGIAEPNVEGGRFRLNKLRMDFRLGGEDEDPYTFLIERASFLEGSESSTTSSIWTSTAKGNGVASACLLAAGDKQSVFSKTYPDPTMRMSWVVDLARMYDPRDEAQDPDDESTWSYAPRNFALNMLWFLCFSEYGRQKNYATAVLPVLDDWIEQINICDELVALKEGGFRRRYEVGWTATTDNATQTVMRELTKAADAWISERPDGTVILRVGKYIAPTITIEDSDIVGFQRASGVPEAEAVNELMGSYTSPDHDWTTAEIGPIVDDDDQLARGRRLAQRAEFPFVQSASLCSVLMKREMQRRKEPHRGKLFLNMFSRNGLNAAFERWIAIGESRMMPRLSGLVIENLGARVSVTKGVVELDFISTGAYIDDFDPEEDEFDAPPVFTGATSSSVPAPSDINAVARLVTQNSTTAVLLDVSFDDPEVEDLEYVVKWRLSDDGGGNPGGWTEDRIVDPPAAETGRITLTTSPVPVNTTLDVTVIAIGARTESPEPDFVIVSTILDNVAPSEPVILSAIVAGTDVTVSVQAPSSSNVRFVRVYRADETDPFGDAVDISGAVSAAAGQIVTVVDTVMAGSYDYFATAENVSGVESTEAGPETVVVV